MTIGRANMGQQIKNPPNKMSKISQKRKNKRSDTSIDSTSSSSENDNKKKGKKTHKGQAAKPGGYNLGCNAKFLPKSEFLSET